MLLYLLTYGHIARATAEHFLICTLKLTSRSKWPSGKDHCVPIAVPMFSYQLQFLTPDSWSSYSSFPSAELGSTHDS